MLTCLLFNIFSNPQNLSTKHLTFFSHISANQYAESAGEFTTEGLYMPSDEEELFYGHTLHVEKVSCERPCGPAVHLATGLCFFAQKEPTAALCNGKLCCPLLFYFLLMSQSEQAQLFP